MYCTALTHETSGLQTATVKKYTELGPGARKNGGGKARMEVSHYNEAFPCDGTRKL